MTETKQYQIKTFGYEHFVDNLPDALAAYRAAVRDFLGYEVTTMLTAPDGTRLRKWDVSKDARRERLYSLRCPECGELKPNQTEWIRARGKCYDCLCIVTEKRPAPMLAVVASNWAVSDGPIAVNEFVIASQSAVLCSLSCSVAFSLRRIRNLVQDSAGRPESERVFWCSRPICGVFFLYNGVIVWHHTMRSCCGKQEMPVNQVNRPE